MSRKGKIALIIILLILAAAAACALYYNAAERSLSVTFTDENPEVTCGERYATMDYVASSGGDVTPEREYLATDTSGEHEMKFTVSRELFGGLKEISEDYTFTYTVVDDVAPVVLNSGNGAIVQRGTEFNIDEVVGYADNADPSPKLSLEGSVDMSKNGSYPLHATVTDASGNSTEWDFTVTVADSVPAAQNDAAKVNFADFCGTYAGDGRSFGIDVSVFQGDIDFEAVKAAGCDFVIIRIGYSLDGERVEDTNFAQNYAAAKAAGLRIGVYFYSTDNSEEAARESADWIIEKLGGDSLDLPVAFDWEAFANFQTFGMSLLTLNDLYDVFADELKAAGYDCMLYGSRIPLETVWNDTDTRTIWLANYVDATEYTGSYLMWQQSCTGRIDGISGDVDMDILYE